MGYCCIFFCGQLAFQTLIDINTISCDITFYQYNVVINWERKGEREREHLSVKVGGFLFYLKQKGTTQFTETMAYQVKKMYFLFP